MEGLTVMQEDVHFWSIHSMGLITNTAKFFLFPEMLGDCLSYLQLPTGVQKLNSEAKENKPKLNDKELLLFEKIYSNDIQLHKQIKEK